MTWEVKMHWDAQSWESENLRKWLKILSQHLVAKWRNKYKKWYFSLLNSLLMVEILSRFISQSRFLFSQKETVCDSLSMSTT